MFSSRLLEFNFSQCIEEILVRVKLRQYELYIAVCVFLVVYFIRDIIKSVRSNYPPGPIGLPFVGYLPFMSKNIHLDLIEIGKKYGEVFSIKLGTETIIVLNSAAAIKDAYTKSEFLGRPPHGVSTFFPYESAFFKRDIHVWREQRRFVVQSMKDLGLGKSKIEGEMQDEINQFLDILRSTNGKALDLRVPLSPSMSNNICALVFGKRLDFNDPDRKSLDENLEKATETSAQASLPTLFPWIRHFPFIKKFLDIGRGIEAFEHVIRFCRREVELHKRSFDPSIIRDFIDSFLVEMEPRKAKDPNTSFNEDILTANAVDLFAAGSETVRTSILWTIYTIAGHQDVQKKVQREILDVLGPSRSPEYPDQKEMPYTHAVILEVMRWKTIVPLNVLHYTVADTTCKGYDIPQGRIVIANLWAVHHDPKVWDEPDTFKPERFLSLDGKSVVKPGNFMPFSYGKRACPGETMANMEIFLYFTSILQKFDVVFPDGVKPTFQGVSTGTYGTEPYEVRLIARTESH